MLIIEIGLGILLGYFLVMHWDKLIVIIIGLLSLAVFIALMALLLAGGAWIVNEHTSLVYGASILIASIVILGIGCFYVASWLGIDAIDAPGVFLMLLFSGFMLFIYYGIWDSYIDGDFLYVAFFLSLPVTWVYCKLIHEIIRAKITGKSIYSEENKTLIEKLSENN